MQHNFKKMFLKYGEDAAGAVCPNFLPSLQAEWKRDRDHLFTGFVRVNPDAMRRGAHPKPRNLLLNRYSARIIPFLKWLGLILLLFVGGSCSEDPSREPAPLARVGNRVIDWRMLQRSFHLEPHWHRGISYRVAYFTQLDYLIEQKLFAQQAEALGLDAEEPVAGILQANREKEMIKELYRQEVASRVTITEEEYRAAYQRAKKKVKLEFVYTPDSSRAALYAGKLLTTPMEQLPLYSPADQKGTTPLFSFGDMAPEVEAVAFDMEPGEVRGPIRVKGRFMVIKLIDGEVDKFLSETDFAQQKSKIHKVLFERRARRISREYLHRVLRNKGVHINPPVFRALQEQFSRVMHNKTSDTPFPIYLNDQELDRARTQLEDLRDAVLVTFKGGEFTVGDFLRHLWYTPSSVRPQVNLAPQLKKAIAVMVRNYYLAQEAYRRGLDRSPRVAYEVQAENDRVLAEYYLKKVRQEITVTPEEISRFMREESFTALNREWEGELDTAAARAMLREYKFSLRRQELADSLRNLFPVQVDTTGLLSHIPDPDQPVSEKPIPVAYIDQFYIY